RISPEPPPSFNSARDIPHVVEATPMVINESFAFFHRYRLQPGHPPTSVGPQRKGVTHVPGFMRR
ncbi:MAG: hypothetical protein O2930_16170, partial [Acidobacteria bacterium]|nr:hypothetical protein [Acidobacteriota bacterium]